MDKLPFIIWIIAAPVFMGVFVMVVILHPALAVREMEYMPYAAAAGALVAMPVSILIARKMRNMFGH